MSFASLTTADVRLRADVAQQLEWDSDVDASRIGVIADDGIVTLTGFVASCAEKLAAGRAARRVRGVRAINNDVRVTVPHGSATLIVPTVLCRAIFATPIRWLVRAREIVNGTTATPAEIHLAIGVKDEIVTADAGGGGRALGTVRAVASAPVIYSVLLPLALLDLWTTLYQWLCFPLYGISRIDRNRYFMLDHGRLPYLTPLEKLNCVYCSYATGVLAYVRDITARTEAYWCPIKHRQSLPVRTDVSDGFATYGDAAGFHRVSPRIRQRLRLEAATRRRSPRKAA